jgi:hypothetical protein
MSRLCAIARRLLGLEREHYIGCRSNAEIDRL